MHFQSGKCECCESKTAQCPGVKGRELAFTAVNVNEGFTKEVVILSKLSIFSYIEVHGTFRIKEITRVNAHGL